jgi:hypothetical protein
MPKGVPFFWSVVCGRMVCGRMVCGLLVGTRLRRTNLNSEFRIQNSELNLEP